MTSFYDRALPEGGSGYFSEPTAELDPNLFLPADMWAGGRLRPEVREWLLSTLAGGLVKYLDLAGAEHWLHAWLAGSGITYQWSADRGNGDLDVLFGVHMVEFVHWNPDYQGVPEGSVAGYINDKLKRDLWPRTAHTRFGDREYEVTFFCVNGD